MWSKPNEKNPPERGTKPTRRLIIYDVLPPVLVPGLHLGVAELQWSSKLHPVLDTQVLLFLETSFQPRQLLVAERCPSFTRFLQPGSRVRDPALTWQVHMTSHQSCPSLKSSAWMMMIMWSCKILTYVCVVNLKRSHKTQSEEEGPGIKIIYPDITVHVERCVSLFL